MGFALSHGGWPYLAGSAFLILVSEYLYNRIVLSDFSLLSFRPKRMRSGRTVAWRLRRYTRGIYKENNYWKDFFRGLSTTPPVSVETTGGLPWKEVLAVCAGVAIGLLFHPNRTNLLSFAWTQIVTIGLKTPLDQVALGKEWLPAAPGMVLASLAPWVILLLLAILGTCLAPRKIFDEAHARGALAFAVISSALVALSFKSWRNVEYLVPTICLSLALLWQLIDLSRLLSFFQFVIPTDESARSGGIPSKGSLAYSDVVATRLYVGFVRLRSGRQGAWKVFFISIFLLLFAQSTFALWRGFRTSPFPDTMFQETMGEISKRAVPGDRVFHVWWDDFPMLFAADQRLRYVSGLDPTFLYVVNPVLSDEMHTLMQHPASSTQADIWRVVHEETRSRFLLLDLRRDGELVKIVENDARYAKISENNEAIAWEVR
jgi:hypothetical protein